MKKITRLTALLCTAVMLTGSIIGCSNNSKETNTANATTSTAVTTGQLLDNGATNPTGLPITKEKVKLKAVINYSSLRPNMDTTNIWKWLADKTNIELEVSTLKDAEKVSLMFASRDFPDLALSIGASSKQIADAAEGDDLIELEPLLKQYAPTWTAFLKENPMVYKSSLASDGKLYTLPYCDFAPYDRNIRDMWFVMDTWLKELNLQTPKTTEDFVKVLTAVKQNAGKGSIPSNVIPYYYMFDNYVGGQFDIYGSFGVYVTSSDYLYVDNGVVKYQAINPDIKEPVKYLRRLYQLGLTPPESFTDDFTTYSAKISSNPPIIFSYSSYAGRQSIAAAIPPLDSGNGKKPLMRSQAYTPGPAFATLVFANNKYPVATTRLFEYIVDNVEATMTVGRGTKGVVWDVDSSGKAYMKFWEESPDLMNKNAKDLGVHNSWIGIRDQKFYESKFNVTEYQVPGSRAWAYKNVYEKLVMPNSAVYVSGTLSNDDNNLMKQYGTDLNNLRKQKFADWITGKSDIDAEWNSYVEQMKKLNLDKWIDLKQKAYDKLK